MSKDFCFSNLARHLIAHDQTFNDWIKTNDVNIG